MIESNEVEINYFLQNWSRPLVNLFSLIIREKGQTKLELNLSFDDFFADLFTSLFVLSFKILSRIDSHPIDSKISISWCNLSDISDR